MKRKERHGSYEKKQIAPQTKSAGTNVQVCIQSAGQYVAVGARH